MSNYPLSVRTSFVDISLRNTYHYTAALGEICGERRSFFFLLLIIDALDDVPIERETHFWAVFESTFQLRNDG